VEAGFRVSFLLADRCATTTGKSIEIILFCFLRILSGSDHPIRHKFPCYLKRMRRRRGVFLLRASMSTV